MSNWVKRLFTMGNDPSLIPRVMDTTQMIGSATGMWNNGGGVPPKPTASDALLEKILGHEGGYVNNPADRGGATNFGITQNTWGDRGSVEDITRDQAKDYYRDLYTKRGINRVPEHMRDVFFDMVVNHGYGNATKMLQGLGGVEQDGLMGPGTLGAIKDKTREDLINYRGNYYDQIVENDPSQEVFLKGWHNRNESFRNEGGGIPDLNDPTNRDTVPAMLTPGEFVLNKEASQMFRPQIEAMNNAGLQQRHKENQMIKKNMGGPLSVRGYKDGTETYDGSTREEWEAYINDPNLTVDDYIWLMHETQSGRAPQWLTDQVFTNIYSRPDIMPSIPQHYQRVITGWYQDQAGKENIDQTGNMLTEEQRYDLDFNRLLEDAGGLMEDGTIPLKVRSEMEKLHPGSGMIYAVGDQSGMIQPGRTGPNQGMQDAVAGYAAGTAPYESAGLHSVPEVDAIMRSKVTSPQEKASRIVDLVNQGVINQFRARDIMKKLGVDPYAAGSGVTMQERRDLGVPQPRVDDVSGMSYPAHDAIRTPNQGMYDFQAGMMAGQQRNTGRLDSIMKGKMLGPQEKADAIYAGITEGTIDQEAGYAAINSLGLNQRGNPGVPPIGAHAPPPYEVGEEGDLGTAPTAPKRPGSGGVPRPGGGGAPPKPAHKYDNIPDNWFVNQNRNPNEEGNFQFAGVEFTGATPKKGRILINPNTGEEYREGQRLVNRATGQHWIYGG